MELESLACNHCGAPLQVPRGVNFLTCNHCGRQLAIRRTADATYTEVLGELQRSTERISEQLEELTRQNALAQLDREWEQERERHMVADKHGRRHVPTEGSLVGGTALAVVFGVIWMVFAANAGGGGFALFGLVFIAVAVVAMIHGQHKAREYRQAERRYRQRRADVLRSSAADLPDAPREPSPEQYLGQFDTEEARARHRSESPLDGM